MSRGLKVTVSFNHNKIKDQQISVAMISQSGPPGFAEDTTYEDLIQRPEAIVESCLSVLGKVMIDNIKKGAANGTV